VLKELIESGKVLPVMDKTCPMHEVRETIRYLNEGHTRDKVVITVFLPNYKHGELRFRVMFTENGIRRVDLDRVVEENAAPSHSLSTNLPKLRFGALLPEKDTSTVILSTA
jgi:hypothetical protein